MGVKWALVGGGPGLWVLSGPWWVVGSVSSCKPGLVAAGLGC
jgi:hypothetical protein